MHLSIFYNLSIVACMPKTLNFWNIFTRPPWGRWVLVYQRLKAHSCHSMQRNFCQKIRVFLMNKEMPIPFLHASIKNQAKLISLASNRQQKSPHPNLSCKDLWQDSFIFYLFHGLPLAPWMIDTGNSYHFFECVDRILKQLSSG